MSQIKGKLTKKIIILLEETNSGSAKQEIPGVVWNEPVHHAHWSAAVYAILGQMDPAQNLILYFLYSFWLQSK
jgi:hypothetical protein